MPLELHRQYGRQEAVAALVSSSAPAEFCRGAFVVLERDVLCFTTVSDAAPSCQFDSPSTFSWRPGAAPAQAEFQLPAAVTEVWDAERRQRLKQHHLLVRRPGADAYLYAGPAHLASWGGSPGDWSAQFHLRVKLPRAEWVALGGYPGWLVEVLHRPVRLQPGDDAGFEALVVEVAHAADAHVTLTRYEEDAFHLLLNPRRAWVMYLREPGDTGLYIGPAEVSASRTARFRCGCGTSLEFPTEQTVARQCGIDLAREFFRSGVLPSSIAWHEQ